MAPGAVSFRNEQSALLYAATVPGSQVLAVQSTSAPVDASTPGFKPVTPGQIDPATIPNISGGQKNLATYHVGPHGAYWEWMDESRGNIKQRAYLPKSADGAGRNPFRSTVYVVLTQPPPKPKAKQGYEFDWGDVNWPWDLRFN